VLVIQLGSTVVDGDVKYFCLAQFMLYFYF